MSRDIRRYTEMKTIAAKPANRYLVPALAQGLSLLALFSRERPVWTAPEIVAELALARATVFRLLKTLEAAGYVARDESGRGFRLGAAVLSRGFAYLSSSDLVEVAQPVLRRLRDETGLSAHLVVREGTEVIYLARYAANSTLSSSVNVGTRFPVHATTLGRMAICELSDAELKTLYPDPVLPRFSDQTPGTREELAGLLAGDRKRGFAASQSFFERGVNSIAAAVRDKSGKIVAAINITAVESHVTLDEMNGKLKDKVLEAAAEISRWIVPGPTGGSN